MLAFLLIASIFAIDETSPQKHDLLHRMKRAAVVIGGSPTDISEYPYSVQIHFQENGIESRCGGTAVAERWVLTAAHCIKNSENEARYLVWSSTTWYPWEDNPEVPVNCINDCYMHPQFVLQPIDYDVALIYVRGNKVFTQIQTIALGTATPPVDTLLHVVGWGTGPEESALNILHEVDVPVVAISKCNTSYEGTITERMLCAGFDMGGKDACPGDSGGPAVAQRVSGDLAVFGITSFGFYCGLPRYYGVYTDVSTVISWIESTMASR